MKISLASPSRELEKIDNFEDRFNYLLKEGNYIGGDLVDEFEANLKSFLGIKYSITLNSGTDALLMGLLAIGIREGDEVLVPSFTFFASVECILHLRAVPVFVDIDPINYCMDTDDMKSKTTNKTKAIIPVDLFGNDANIQELYKFAKNNNLSIVEDVAQAFGSKDSQDNYLGTVAEIGAFSFFPSKTLGGIGDGGMIATNNEKFYELISKLKNHGQKSSYEHEILGHNSRLDTLNAFVLNEKLKIFPEIVNGRNNFYSFYKEGLKNFDWLELPKKNNKDTLLNYFTVKVQPEIRKKFLNYLNDSGIGNAIYYKKPIHHQKALERVLKNKISLPVTDEMSNSVVSLPYYSFPKDSELDYILSKFIEFKP